MRIALLENIRSLSIPHNHLNNIHLIKIFNKVNNRKTEKNEHACFSFIQQRVISSAEYFYPLILKDFLLPTSTNSLKLVYFKIAKRAIK